MAQLSFLGDPQSEKWNYARGVKNKTQKKAIFLVRRPIKEASESQRRWDEIPVV